MNTRTLIALHFENVMSFNPLKRQECTVELPLDPGPYDTLQETQRCWSIEPEEQTWNAVWPEINMSHIRLTARLRSSGFIPSANNIWKSCPGCTACSATWLAVRNMCSDWVILVFYPTFWFIASFIPQNLLWVLLDLLLPVFQACLLFQFKVNVIVLNWNCSVILDV